MHLIHHRKRLQKVTLQRRPYLRSCAHAPLRAATSRESRGGHRACEAAGRPCMHRQLRHVRRGLSDRAAVRSGCDRDFGAARFPSLPIPADWQEVTQPDHGCPAAPVEPCVPDLAQSGGTRFSVVRSGPHAEPERTDCGVLGPGARLHRSVTAAPWAARTNCRGRARSLGGPPTSAVNIPSADHACRNR